MEQCPDCSDHYAAGSLLTCDALSADSDSAGASHARPDCDCGLERRSAPSEGCLRTNKTVNTAISCCGPLHCRHSRTSMLTKHQLYSSMQLGNALGPNGTQLSHWTAQQPHTPSEQEPWSRTCLETQNRLLNAVVDNFRNCQHEG